MGSVKKCLRLVLIFPNTKTTKPKLWSTFVARCKRYYVVGSYNKNRYHISHYSLEVPKGCAYYRVVQTFRQDDFLFVGGLKLSFSDLRAAIVWIAPDVFVCCCTDSSFTLMNGFICFSSPADINYFINESFNNKSGVNSLFKIRREWEFQDSVVNIFFFSFR